MEKLGEEFSRHDALYQIFWKASENYLWLIVIYTHDMGIWQQSMI